MLLSVEQICAQKSGLRQTKKLAKNSVHRHCYNILMLLCPANQPEVLAANPRPLRSFKHAMCPGQRHFGLLFYDSLGSMAMGCLCRQADLATHSAAAITKKVRLPSVQNQCIHLLKPARTRMIYLCPCNAGQSSILAGNIPSDPRCKAQGVG